MSGQNILGYSVAFLAVAFVTYVGIADRYGKFQAESLCATISIGEDEATARAKMKASSAFIKRLDDKQFDLVAAFRGMGAEKYECVVSRSKNRVTSKSVAHDD